MKIVKMFVIPYFLILFFAGCTPFESETKLMPWVNNQATSVVQYAPFQVLPLRKMGGYSTKWRPLNDSAFGLPCIQVQLEKTGHFNYARLICINPNLDTFRIGLNTLWMKPLPGPNGWPAIGWSNDTFQTVPVTGASGTLYAAAEGVRSFDSLFIRKGDYNAGRLAVLTVSHVDTFVIKW